MGKQGSVRLAGVAVCACAALFSCSTQSPSDRARSSSRTEPRGSVGLSLVPVSGVTLNSVHYAVTNGATPAVVVGEGDLPTPGTAKEFSFGLSLPVGAGYSISLSAESAEANDKITCGAYHGPFDVAPNSSTNFTLTLICHDDASGGVLGNVDKPQHELFARAELL